jgi:hypothetical protein
MSSGYGNWLTQIPNQVVRDIYETTLLPDQEKQKFTKYHIFERVGDNIRKVSIQ